MVLIQLLLPVPPRAVSPEGSSSLGRTRAELTAQFKGVTAYVRSPAKGLWTAPDGRTEEDDVVMIEVVTATFDRAWWRAYAKTLAGRFEQEEIHLRALDIVTVDDD